mmetsp:Transcript_5057/g.5661  ORF Transcript_5057/g.5661 Transcript_5057/m.5661 type:complete len:480 (+) Transcript_5057:60-1499(+)
MWKLDLLETKYHGSSPRFPHTKKLLSARNNNKLLKKLSQSRDEAEKEILALKEDHFHKKYYGAYKKISKEVNKHVKSDVTKWKADDSKEGLLEFFEVEDRIQELITSKLIKCITSSILINKELKLDPPKYIPSDIRNIITDKSHKSNPSAFFINYCQNNKDLNNYISNLWNIKSIKPLLGEIEWSFKMVRGDLTKFERDARKKLVGKDIQTDFNEDKKESTQSESDDGSDISEGDMSDDNKKEAGDNESIDAEDMFEKFAEYDNLVVDSDEEEKFDLDPNVNYNEVTDEESSEMADDINESVDGSDDSFFEENDREAETSSKREYNLPQLATGYFSGGSDDEDDEIDNDNVVKEATTQRKNRRGQRARQKIWAQKYGKEAKHVKKEQVIIASERERKRLEYEERCKKRELKAKMNSAPTGSNTAPLAERRLRSNTEVGVEKPVEMTKPIEKEHPSWVAKRLAEEKQKNAKFQGTKIKFD